MLLKGVAANSAGYLRNMALSHDCARHVFFERLTNPANAPLTKKQALALLANYDAHAALLRRLLLRAAAYMPEPAVGFVLENVRNEYGNGDYSQCHQGQLLSLARQLTDNAQLDLRAYPLTKGVKKYINEVGRFYRPRLTASQRQAKLYSPAITAGAITATELLALEEFKALQTAFRVFGLEDHCWFDHVNVECEHGDESLFLAEFFIEKHQAVSSVEFGFKQMLAVNLHLYDGLFSAIEANGGN